ncbi:hypothetical protein QOT17_012113 [Balamuthia mandrillaris]
MSEEEASCGSAATTITRKRSGTVDRIMAGIFDEVDATSEAVIQTLSSLNLSASSPDLYCRSSSFTNSSSFTGDAHREAEEAEDEGSRLALMKKISSSTGALPRSLYEGQHNSPPQVRRTASFQNEKETEKEKTESKNEAEHTKKKASERPATMIQRGSAAAAQNRRGTTSTAPQDPSQQPPVRFSYLNRRKARSSSDTQKSATVHDIRARASTASTVRKVET